MKQIETFVKTFVTWTLVGVFGKLLFLAVYGARIPLSGAGDWFAVVWHGLRLDFAIAGYVSVVPALVLIWSLWSRSRLVVWAWRGWFAFAAVAVSLAVVANLGLYGYWGFPLDNTPLLYLRTSPADAFASMTFWQLTLPPLGVAAMASGLYVMFAKLGDETFRTRRSRTMVSGIMTTVLTVCTALLIIPIRGGVSSGVNHTGSVYYSTNQRLNHAAVNPVFSFFEAVHHSEDFGSRYRFMSRAEMRKTFAGMVRTELRQDAEPHDYNVIVVCLESFSKYIMEESGHVRGVVPNLERYSKEGLYFANFYSSSFRTDRAVVSILSGLPAPTTISVMDQPRISTSLPSLAGALHAAGYDTRFFYGGDADYSNMRSYIMGTGFKSTIDQRDFPGKLVTGKWGVADGALYDRVLADIRKHSGSGKPFFKTILTGSSHEPFDVPDYRKLPDPALNAFSYADACLGRFIEGLKRQPCWENTLVVLVPDHLGAYPEEVDNTQLWRYQIPLVILGGPIKEPARVETYGAQSDICATVLGLLGKPHGEFAYSKDLLDPQAPHFAFFTVPDAMGIVADGGFVFYDNRAQSIVTSDGDNYGNLLVKAEAYLQRLYDDMEERRTGK